MISKTVEEDNQDRARSSSVSLNGQLPWLDNLPTDFHTILDVGCGAGYHSKYFHDRGYDVTAIDYDMKAFEFCDDIKAVELGLFEFNSDKMFDAVICSHVFEHFPNTMQAFKKVRSLLNPGGYLFAVVPSYTPYVCNGHWSTGWNVGQLGSWLVSSGFDCRCSTFAKLGINVCGFGRKSDEVPILEYGFSLPVIIDFMPSPLNDLHIFLGPDELIRADISWLDAQRVVEEPKVTKTALTDFKFSQLFAEMPLIGNGSWNDRVSRFDLPRDLQGSEIIITVMVEGAPTPLRLCLGSGYTDGPFANNADYWNEYPVGISVITVRQEFLIQRMGTIDWSKIDQLSFGGPIPEGSLVYFGIFDGSGRLLASN